MTYIIYTTKACETKDKSQHIIYNFYVDWYLPRIQEQFYTRFVVKFQQAATCCSNVIKGDSPNYHYHAHNPPPPLKIITFIRISTTITSIPLLLPLNFSIHCPISVPIKPIHIEHIRTTTTYYSQNTVKYILKKTLKVHGNNICSLFEGVAAVNCCI